MADEPAYLSLVSLSAAKDQLRIDGTDDDTWLQTAIWGASHAVVQWCGGDETKLLDADGQYLPNVITAALVEVAYRYTNREGPDAAYVLAWYANGYPLSAGATAFLQSLHKPVCA